jgi:hypothetical protein
MALRFLPPIVAVAVLALLLSPQPAGAGKAWCMTDPVIELNGQVIDVQAYAYVNTGQIEDSEYIFTVAPGSTLQLLDPGPDRTIAVYVVPGATNSVTYRVIDSPVVNIKLTVTARTSGPASSTVIQAFGRAVAAAWPSTGGTVPSIPITVETTSLTPAPITTSTPTATPAPTNTATSTVTLEPTATATTQPTPTATSEPTSTATIEPTPAATTEPTLEATLDPTLDPTFEPTTTPNPAV